MSDKKMNDFPTAADGAFVYAEDANGNQIKISKADLASVVAELISGETITNSSQFDKIRTTGFYEVTITDGTFQISYGALLCFKLGSWYKTIQIIFSQTEPKIIYRIATSDSWSEWKKL